MISNELVERQHYEPDWKSKMVVRLLGKRRTNVLLDTIQLMTYQEFKESQESAHISWNVTMTIVGANFAVLGTSYYLSRTLFRSFRLSWVWKVAMDVFLVGLGCYGGAFIVANRIEQQVNLGKTSFLKTYDPSFMHHFDILCSKYEIYEDIQLDSIFTDEQRQQWLEGYLDNLAKQQRYNV